VFIFEKNVFDRSLQHQIYLVERESFDKKSQRQMSSG
jgi:hypothetical protein